MTTGAAEVSFETVEIKRRAFARALGLFRKGGGRYHHPAPPLPAEKYRGCEVLPDRFALLDRLPKGAVIAEVGVDRGEFSAEILQRCAPARLCLIDHEPARLSDPQILSALSQENADVTLHAGDSVACLEDFPPETFDVIYLDADHSYEGVRRDIAAALPRLKPRGALVFNDYAVWSPTTMFHCGVARAVNELCLQSDWRLRYLAMQPMMYNDVMLVRG